MKKSNLKTSEPLTQIGIKDHISVSDNKEDGGTTIVPKTKMITLTDQIKEFITNSKVHVSQFRLIIEDINKDTAKLVDDLWDTGITFIVSSSTDLVALNIQPAAAYPRASESIDMMLDLIERLIDAEFAYVGSDSSVYFSAEKFATYGAISGNKLDSLEPGHRYEYSEDGAKHFHADWALWKAAGDRTEMVWDSPWGKGFPGWHIECSAMSLELLAGHVDIHVGGIDLRFPHHENERAQSNALINQEAVDLWVHGEHLLFEGKKMSKSSGNVVLLKDVIERGFDPLAIRLCFLENKYRSQMDLTWNSIEAADETLKRWRNKIAPWGTGTEITVDPEIEAAFNTDLDTSRAVMRLREIEKSELADKGSVFRYADQVLGLDLGRPIIKRVLTSQMQKLLEDRALARSEKRWSDSDRLRDELEALGLEIKDTPEGQNWS